MQLEVLKLCIYKKDHTVFNFIRQNNPQLFKELIDSVIKAPDDEQRDKLLASFNRNFSLLPEDTFNNFVSEFDAGSKKAFICYCYEHQLLALTHELSQHIEWQAGELEEFFQKLILGNHNSGAKQLLAQHPELMHVPNLVNQLLAQNLLGPLQQLILQDMSFDSSQFLQIVEKAINKKNTNLLELLISTDKIPTGSDLLHVLKQAIKAGNDGVLAPFINAQKDLQLDFKALFLLSVECKNLKLANQLLVKEIDLSRMRSAKYTYKPLTN